MLKYLAFIFFFFTGNVLHAQEYEGVHSYADTFSTGGEEIIEDGDNRVARHIRLQPVPLPMETERRNFDKQQWEGLINDPAFNYDDPYKDQENAQSPGVWAALMLAIVEFFTSDIGIILLWVILGATLVYIIFRMLKIKGNLFFAKKDKKSGGLLADEYADEYVPEDWDKAIREAAEHNNYRLAVRHVYRYLLSILSESGKINYQSAKTNYQYAYELNGTNLHQPFLFMTRQYEYAWYGGFDLQQQQFEHYYNQLKKIQSSLV